MVKIPLLQRHLSPVNHREKVHLLQYALKPLDPQKQFWFDTHLEIEHIDESAIAKSDLSRNVSER